MENFKDILNKINNGHTFIKFNDLEQGKPYKVNSFEKINTKFGKKLSVVLNDEFILSLPERYTNAFTEKQITLYNTSSDKNLNLIYNGEKKLNKGKTMHLIDFE